MKLGDVAIVKTSGTAASKSVEASSKKLNQRKTATITTATANAGTASQLRRKPDPTAFQAPEGTHAKRKKRPSRLKRIYRRTKAEAAVQHWLSVLSAIEESLQIVGELLGAVTNEMQALEQVEKDVFTATQAQEEANRKNLTFAQALQAGNTLQNSSFKNNTTAAVFTPSVQLQVLHEQVKVASEQVEQLGSIHATARANLVKSQEQLLTAQGGGNAGGGKSKATIIRPLTTEVMEENHDVGAIVNTAAPVEAITAPAPAAPPSADAELPPAPPAISPPANLLAITEDRNSAEAASEESASRQSSQESSTTTSSSGTNSTSNSTSSSSSSGSDFGLQWGDTLRTWATTVGVDARKTLQQQQKQKQVKNKKQKNDDMKKEEFVEKKAIAQEPVVVKETHNSLPKHPDTKLLLPISPPPTAPLPQLPQPLLPPPTATDAVRSWLEGAEDVDTQEAASNLDDNDEFSLGEELEVHKPSTDLPFQPCLDTTTTATTSPSSAHPFHCTVCNITASGLKPWEDHLASRRHASKVVQIANPRTTAAAAASKKNAEIEKNSQSALLSGSNKCYTGPNADVEPYVTHIITPELNTATTALLNQLLEWQERTRRLDPVNFKRKRRLVSGMREVEKSVKMNKAKLLIVAPNIGPVPTTLANPESDTKGSKDDKIKNDPQRSAPSSSSSSAAAPITSLSYPIQAALDMAKERGIPTVFALTRQRMGKILGARKTASAFVVLDASGAEQLLAKVLELATSGGEVI